MPRAQALGVGHEQVVADQLHALAEPLGQRSSSRPSPPRPCRPRSRGSDSGPPSRPSRPTISADESVRPSCCEHVGAVLAELAGRGVERDREVLARACSRPPRCPRMSTSSAASFELEVGREAALVADGGGQAAVVQRPLQRVEDLDARAQPLGEGGGADRHDHELLEVDVVVGVRAAVERRSSSARAARARAVAAEVAPERQSRPPRPRPWRRRARRRGSRSRRAGPCWACRRARSWRGRVASWSAGSMPSTACGQLAVDVRDGLRDALAAPGVAAVAQLDGLELAGGRAGRHRGAAGGARPRAATSTSTVGLPRLSRICRPCTLSISLKPSPPVL